VSIAEKIGCWAKTLRTWVRQAECDQGRRPGLTTEECQRLKDLERENFELRAAGQRDPEESVRLFRPGGARPPTEVMVAFIDEHRDTYRVEPKFDLVVNLEAAEALGLTIPQSSGRMR